MAYQTGSAADATALRTAITAFAAANGWTWDATNEVISNGNVVCKLTVPSSGELRIQGGDGVDVNGVLLNPAASFCRIMDFGTNKLITWPVTYHIFLNTSPADLVCLINFDVDYWQWLGLGQCINLGVPGTAAWFGASMPQDPAPNMNISESGSSSGYNGFSPHAPFWTDVPGNYGMISSSYLHCLIDGSDGVVFAWSNASYASLGRFYQGITPLLQRQPNAWNSEAILLPARIVIPRPSSLYSYAAEMPHARLLRINNYDGGDLITIGTDTWFVAPFFRKNTTAQTSTDSGTFGWAIRYVP